MLSHHLRYSERSYTISLLQKKSKQDDGAPPNPALRGAADNLGRKQLWGGGSFLWATLLPRREHGRCKAYSLSQKKKRDFHGERKKAQRNRKGSILLLGELKACFPSDFCPLTPSPGYTPQPGRGAEPCPWAARRPTREPRSPHTRCRVPLPGGGTGSPAAAALAAPCPRPPR